MRTLLYTIITCLLFCSEALAGVADHITSSTIRFVNPFNSTQTVDLTGWYLSINSTFYNVNTLNIQSGSLSLPPNSGGTVVFDGLNIPMGQGSIGLWIPSTDTSNPTSTSLFDFVQWGAGGQAFESEAVSEFLWAAGTFINGNMPFTRTEFALTGPSTWQTNTSTSVESDLVKNNIIISPNPAQDHISISNDLPGESHYQLFDLTGKLLLERVNITESVVDLPVKQFAKGTYFIRIVSSNGDPLATQKVFIQ